MTQSTKSEQKKPQQVQDLSDYIGDHRVLFKPRPRVRKGGSGVFAPKPYRTGCLWPMRDLA
jgi:hypothetical protein